MSDIAAQNHPFSAHLSRSRIPVIFVMAIGVAISFAAFLNFEQTEREARETDFRRVADDKIHAVQMKIQSTFTALQSIRGLYAATDNVDRKEFRRFVETLGLSTAVQALEWIPKVSVAERSKMEARARRDGFARFQFTQRSTQGKMVAASKRETYFPVYYVEPVAGNEAAIGFDLASSPARLAALMQSRDSGEAVATTRITLVQETSDQYGVLVFQPIYRNGMPTKTVEHRRANLAGFALGVFRLGDLVEASTKENKDEAFAVSLRLSDETAPKGSQRLYPKTVSSDTGASTGSELQQSKNLSVAGRIWRIVVTPASDSAFTQRDWKPWLVLLVGLLSTGILAQYLKLTQRRTAYIDLLVTRRTSELQRTAEKLARSNHDLEQFASVAAHDLQEPLRKVQAFGNRLESKYAEVLEDQGRDYLHRMQNAASRMQTLIGDLLAFSRVSSNAAAFKPIDLKQLTREVLSDLEVRIEETGATVSFSNLPKIEGDPLQLRQLIQNLLGNSLKYRREGVPPNINVSSRILDGVAGKQQQLCELVIADNGIGFDGGYGEKIFGIFQRLHGRTQYEGTGVGLAICRKIAEHHGGTISASGVANQGATFTVVLPVNHPDGEGSEL